jgi:hypothetical protein
MSWLEEIRQKPRKEKIKAISRITGVALVILLILWIIFTFYFPAGSNKNPFWQSVKNQINDAKQESSK